MGAMQRIAVAGGVLLAASLAACGSAPTSTGAASSTPPTPVAATIVRSASPSPNSEKCHGGPDVDIVVSVEGGGWVGGAGRWCYPNGQTQVEIAERTVASERFAGGWVECDLIALDSKNPQIGAWEAGDQSRRPHLSGLIAEIGNC